MLLGAHCSIGGGLEKACEQASLNQMNCIQIFTKNQRQWKERTVSEAESQLFKFKMKEYGIKIAFSHTTYLINLASADDEIRNKSIISLAAELIRCNDLGIPYAVLHPGANREISPEAAIQRISDGLKIVLEHTKELNTTVLLENTAGQGSSIGRKFSQIGQIIKETSAQRVGMCFDTCHAFAAGYNISTQEGFDTTFEEIEKEVGLKNLKAFHLNDSKGDLGSRIDRHENIGKGKIGLLPFKLIMKRFPEHPKVIETPKEDDMDRINLEVLRNL